MDKSELQKYNYTCYIVGGGSSLKDFDWQLLHNKFVFAINRSYEVLPDAQIVYFTDRNFWKQHKTNLLNHDGQLIQGSIRPGNEEQHDRVTHYLLSGPDGIDLTPGQLKHGSNSTYAAVNLAIQMGFKKIFLLGIDMKWGETGNQNTSHWHDGHERVDTETVYSMMIDRWKTIVEPIEQLGVSVWNVNKPENTNLKCFPLCSVSKAIYGVEGINSNVV